MSTRLTLLTPSLTSDPYETAPGGTQKLRELLSFLLVCAFFILTFALLHLLLGYFSVAGLPALAVYCLPLIAFIAFTTADGPKHRLRAGLRMALWFYSVLLACAVVALWV